MACPSLARSVRTCFSLGALLLLVAGSGPARLAAQAAQPATPVPATAENVTAFLGDWTLAANGANGPATFALSLKVADGKVVGEIVAPTLPRQAITDISKAGPSLVLRYVLDYQGTPVNVLISLTPAEKQVDAYLDFADGAYQLAGIATKKV